MPDTPAPISRAQADIPDIVRRYLDGESIRDIAAEHRVNRQTIYNWLLAETGPQYEQAITRALVNRITDADDLLESAPDSLGVARARELTKLYRQDFERRRPKLYGPKQEISQDHTINIIVNRSIKVAESDNVYYDKRQNGNILDAKPLDSDEKQ